MSGISRLLRKYLTVNYKHVDPHSVYKAGQYRKACTMLSSANPLANYEPGKTPFDKVANNQYFKRDNRRNYPKTQVYVNGQVDFAADTITAPLNRTVKPKLTNSLYPSVNLFK